ncbi:MAG: hypothetical protein MUC91_09460, partial [Verrucomicrobia bacterium]|nr:hypothetical protein [Verrucomicrobiota bacterium]
WRSLVCWSPVVGALVLGGIAVENKSMLFIVLGALLVLVLSVSSLVLPQRGLQDVLAGTWPVPR